MKNMQIAVGLGIAGTALLLFSGCTSASGGFADDVAFMKRHTPIVLLKDGDAAVAEMPSPAETPNVIFILMDDMGYSDVSCYGAKKVKTPHIDQLAAVGIKFTDFHTAASICSPSRAAFLTGAYPQRCGLYKQIPARINQRDGFTVVDLEVPVTISKGKSLTMELF